MQEIEDNRDKIKLCPECDADRIISFDCNYCDGEDLSCVHCFGTGYIYWCNNCGLLIDLDHFDEIVEESPDKLYS